MSQLKTIITSLLEPFSSAEYYQKAIKKSFTNSLFTTFIALFLLSLISGINFLTTQFRTIESIITAAINDVALHYPEDLVFQWDTHKLVANRDSITLAWPSEIMIENMLLPKQFLLYANSDKTPQDSQINPTEYLIYINNYALYHSNAETPELWTAQPLALLFTNETSFFADKQFITDFTKSTLRFLNDHQLEIKLVTLIVFSILFLGTSLWFFIIETIFAILLFKIYSLELTTKQIIKLALHVMIPTVAVHTLASILYTSVPIPLRTLTFWALMFFFSYYFKRKETIN